MRTPTSILTALLLLSAAPPPARADSLTATLGQPLKEVRHRVDIRLKSGVAIYRVRRTFYNGGKKHEEASLAIGLPFGAAATGLRIRGKRQWFKGELMGRITAAALYQKLTGLGPHEPKDPALLQWVWANEVHLQIFPVPPKQRATVEYTLTVPTRYDNGRYTLSYPRHGGAGNLATPILRIHPGGKRRGRITVNGRRVARAQSIALRRVVTRPLPGKLEREPDASYVVSRLRIRRRGSVRTVKVRVDIRHTYKGDLQVRLVDPSGEIHLLHNGDGGDSNDVRQTFAVTLGRQTPLAGHWQLVVSDHARLDVGQLVAWSLRGKVGGRPYRYRARRLPLVLPDAPNGQQDTSQATIRIRPPRINTLTARLGRIVASKGKELFRLELDTAQRLRPLPRRLSVVFVVDASHTMKSTGIHRQLILVRAYLAHVPRARFDVVFYRRYARRLVGAFARARTFRGQVATANKRGLLAPGNGSNLDRGLRLAARILRGRRGAKRIVAFSDDLLHPFWKNRKALRALALAPKDTITHLVIPTVEAYEPVSETRDDNHRLSGLAAKHGGILVSLKTPPRPSYRKLVPLVLGLVRPIRIDGFRVLGLPADHDIELPATLREGTGLREMAQFKRAPRRLTVVGKIWAAPYRKVIRVDPRFTRATAAFVFSHDKHGDLTSAEMKRVAMLGRVVSPVTSFLAIEPGVRPSRAGIDRLSRDSAVSSSSEDALGSLFGSAIGNSPPTPQFEPLMKPIAKRCFAKHKPSAGWTVGMRVLTTYDEIVDVRVQGPTSALTRCLHEGAWKIRLTANFIEEYDRFDFTLP